MRFSRATWIAVSGGIWFAVGTGLMTLGLRFIVQQAEFVSGDTTSLIAKLTPVAGGREQAALMLIVIGLLIGFVKGRFVLVKTVKRVVERIMGLPTPISFSQVYSKGYLMLIGSMILLGISMKWLAVPLAVRGTIDIAIGSALINGAMAYFRAAFAVQK